MVTLTGLTLNLRPHGNAIPVFNKFIKSHPCQNTHSTGGSDITLPFIPVSEHKSKYKEENTAQRGHKEQCQLSPPPHSTLCPVDEMSICDLGLHPTPALRHLRRCLRSHRLAAGDPVKRIS